MGKAKESNGSGAAGLRIRWVRSAIHHPEKIRQTLRGLGLHRLHEIVERPDTPAIRGMIDKVRHLVEVTTAGTKA
ncbi:MAG TPA: 50S ribosomal protein L30 [Candidatus Acidoferrales bacterium]|nr:50S ribosomal protein L30 [Candidatus Acidoferrales bacterium]